MFLKYQKKIIKTVRFLAKQELMSSYQGVLLVFSKVTSCNGKEREKKKKKEERETEEKKIMKKKK